MPNKHTEIYWAEKKVIGERSLIKDFKLNPPLSSFSYPLLTHFVVVVLENEVLLSMSYQPALRASLLVYSDINTKDCNSMLSWMNENNQVWLLFTNCQNATGITHISIISRRRKQRPSHMPKTIECAQFFKSDLDEIRLQKIRLLSIFLSSVSSSLIVWM